MQIKYLFSILIITAFHFSVLGQVKAIYRIASEYCINNKCYIRAYISPSNYNDSNMQKLAKELAAKYKDKEIVNLKFFDDEKIIRAYNKGLREPINIGSDSRAVFIHQAGCGDMLFYKSKDDEIKLVKISWKKEEKCNEPFRTF